MIQVRADFELVGPPSRKGTLEADLSEENGNLVAVRFLDCDEGLTEAEKGEVAANITDLLTKIGPSIVEDARSVEEDSPEKTSH